jgi:hypothetical protein
MKEKSVLGNMILTLQVGKINGSLLYVKKITNNHKKNFDVLKIKRKNIQLLI